jgi:hypothetical protein
MLVHRDESKPRTNHRGHRGGQKRTGKEITPAIAEGSGIQSNAATSVGPTEPADVEMGSSDNPVSQDQLTNDTGMNNITDGPKLSGTAPHRGTSDALSDHRAAQDRKDAAQDTHMEQLTGAMSSLKFVPRNVRLGSKKPGLPPR